MNYNECFLPTLQGGGDADGLGRGGWGGEGERGEAAEVGE